MVQNNLSNFKKDENQGPYPAFDSPVLSGKKNWWLFSILLLATLVTTFLAGGLLFSISLLFILGAHEFGHYWASKKNMRMRGQDDEDTAFSACSGICSDNFCVSNGRPNLQRLS